MVGSCLLGVVLLAGCGGASATAFCSKARPMATQMLKAVEEKNMETIDKMMDVIEKRPTLSENEVAVLKTARDYAKSGDWDSAQSLLESSLAMSTD